MDFLAVARVNDPNFGLAYDADIIIIVGNEETLRFKILLFIRNIYAEITLRFAALFVYLAESFLRTQFKMCCRWRLIRLSLVYGVKYAPHFEVLSRLHDLWHLQKLQSQIRNNFYVPVHIFKNF